MGSLFGLLTLFYLVEAGMLNGKTLALRGSLLSVLHNVTWDIIWQDREACTMDLSPLLVIPS